jgi:hypothetical protein
MSRQYRELDTKIQQAKKYLEFSYDVNSNYLTNIGMLLEAYFQETRTRFWGLGSTTFRIQAKKGGTEPDECYCIGTEKEFPDLAIEVVLSSGGVDKLAVYKKLGFFSILNYSLVFWIISSNSGLAIDDTNFASAVAKAARNFSEVSAGYFSNTCCSVHPAANSPNRNSTDNRVSGTTSLAGAFLEPMLRC